MLLVFVSLCLLAALAACSADDDQPLIVVRSPGDPGVVVSFKRQSRNLCTTAFKDQKQYTGWASIPGEHPTNLFFWFFEARERTESLTIWLNGGPGVSSMVGLFQGLGPCEVVETGFGQYETFAREWGWDRTSNMLFVDQPNKVGFSYDTPSNGTLSFIKNSIIRPPISTDGAPLAWAFVNGTFSNSEARSTANSTSAAAMAVWHLLQGFLSALPGYQPALDAPVGLSLFCESYGGVYGPVFAEAWEKQNEKRRKGVLDPKTTLELRLTSLGIINGCVDSLLQMPSLPTFAARNTYGIKALSDVEAELYLAKFSAKGGCAELLTMCQSVSSWEDGGDLSVAESHCRDAVDVCGKDVENPYYNSGRSPYDIAGRLAYPLPSYLFTDYLNQPSVLRALGSPVNFTLHSEIVSNNFLATGDISKGGNIDRLAALLRRGVRVGLVYGDRDYICNWIGGETVSLAVALRAGGSYAFNFPAAGYAPIVVNSSYIGGDVRQFANLSFSRIFQAGHSAPWYQPETAFQVFARIVRGLSVSMGRPMDPFTYRTTGKPNSTRTDKAPEAPSPTCFVRAFAVTCDDEALMLARTGGGIVINGILYKKSEDWPLASSSLSSLSLSSSSSRGAAFVAAATSSIKTSSPPVVMTGVYVATETPSGGGAACSVPAWGLGLALLLVVSRVL
ncbi:hypothetical protein L249_2687 [Ophiocordyceps polyrhachis-furcata BCC 54312]|uniref:Carboxypeptidase n=1 Tax=Ophiocordyceps polyrhachis-furcata BCC 54312 TaxID=1330021 RepID=A0A367LQG8_9HYPO|nr:hypothetical protein L249_2687 [Ophiocordyceps polyrhachis-furcata BCC 54312]